MNKVNVLQVDEVKIRWFSWYSAWVDICLFNHGHCSYLLQMRISRTNRKIFRVATLGKGSVTVPASDQLHLTQMF
jgi:hypothetical protein